MKSHRMLWGAAGILGSPKVHVIGCAVPSSRGQASVTDRNL